MPIFFQDYFRIGIPTAIFLMGVLTNPSSGTPGSCIFGLFILAIWIELDESRRSGVPIPEISTISERLQCWLGCMLILRRLLVLRILVVWK